MNHTSETRPVRARLTGLAAALADLVLPASCGGCGRPGTGWCDECAADLALQCFPHPRLARPDPCPSGLPPVMAAGRYAGALRAAVVAAKDGGRADLGPALAVLLARSVQTVLAASSRPSGPAAAGVVLVPVPSSPRSVRRRGEASTVVLARRAAAVVPAPVEVAAVVRLGRRVADQSGLDHRARAANLAGAHVVHPRSVARLAGRAVILVDDVVTTGASLAEAARALRAAGADVRAAAVVAATQRRRHRVAESGSGDYGGRTPSETSGR